MVDFQKLIVFKDVSFDDSDTTVAKTEKKKSFQLFLSSRVLTRNTWVASKHLTWKMYQTQRQISPCITWNRNWKAPKTIIMITLNGKTQWTQWLTFLGCGSLLDLQSGILPNVYTTMQDWSVASCGATVTLKYRPHIGKPATPTRNSIEKKQCRTCFRHWMNRKFWSWWNCQPIENRSRYVEHATSKWIQRTCLKIIRRLSLEKITCD